jgi:acyl carrier protein
MPVDSLDLFDVLAEFRQRTGLTIPKRKLRRDTMRSVGAFASFAAREATN